MVPKACVIGVSQVEGANSGKDEERRFSRDSGEAERCDLFPVWEGMIGADGSGSWDL